MDSYRNLNMEGGTPSVEKNEITKRKKKLKNHFSCGRAGKQRIDVII